MVISISLSNNSSVVEISSNSDAYRLLRGSIGMAFAPTEVIETSSPALRGKRVTGVCFPPREIQIAVLVLGESRQQVETRLQALRRAINPVTGTGCTTLIYTGVEGTRYRLDVWSDDPSLDGGIAGSGETFQRATISLIAYDPFFSRVQEDRWVGQPTTFWTFPFFFPFKTPQEQEFVVINEGDVPTPMQVQLIGPCRGFELENLTTDRSMRFTDEVDPGCVLEINTDPRLQTATLTSLSPTLHRTSAMWAFSLDSDFWWLQPGPNRVKFTMVRRIPSRGLPPCRATITWNARYSGV